MMPLHQLVRQFPILQWKSEKISCIPNNSEKYISFSVWNLTFIVSLQFLNSSLEKLVENLSKEGVDKFNTLNWYVESNKSVYYIIRGCIPTSTWKVLKGLKNRTCPPLTVFTVPWPNVPYLKGIMHMRSKFFRPSATTLGTITTCV